MALIQLQKVVAVCLLEGTKLTMDHLGKHRMELGEGVGGEVGRTITSLYGDLRRLRDYMQRCLGAYRDMVDIDLSHEDQRLVVACCRRSVEYLDLQLAATIDPKTRDWLQSRRDMLGDWAVELATTPLLELPLPRLATPPTATMRALETRIAERLGNNRALQFGTSGGRIGSSFGEPTPMTLPMSKPKLATTGVPFDLAPQPLFDSGDEGGKARAPLPAPAQAPAPAAAAPQPAGGAGAAAGAPGAATPTRGQQLIDPRHVRDPRLRALVTMDLRALDRALVAQDHRLVAVHLASILEGAVLDHAIPRRLELGLPPAVETWDPQEVLLLVLGEAATARDRATAHSLFTSRTILRPGIQLVTPTAITSATVQQMLQFVGRALSAMGFAAATR